MKTPARRPIPTLKTLTALTLIAALAALILYAAIPAAAQTYTDYDSDDDGLIDIRTVDQLLEGIRFNSGSDGVPLSSRAAQYNAAFPNRNTSTAGLMGCPGGVCRGYELMNDIDFDSDGDGNSDTPWPDTNRAYTSIFEGNGHTISNLSATAGQYAGLFRTVHFVAVIRNVGLINPSVSGDRLAGALAATNRGAILASYAQGGSVTVTGGPGNGAGGLVGNMDAPSASIVASWSTASVRAAVTGRNVGGLLARQGAGTIIASYAAGSVSSTGTPAFIGGLVGRVNAGAVTTDSYCSDATGQSGCLTAAEMQAPTAYTGIYANWNVDLGNIDSDAFPDNPWIFGTTTTYPTLKTPTQRQADPVVDYDLNDNNLIDIDSLYKLNAIRHDLNGDGLPDNAANYPAYAGAFVNGDFVTTTPAAARMGCPQTCIGYELTQSLEFDTDGDGQVGVSTTSTDPYPNWTPIGTPTSTDAYAAQFLGNGYTITDLTTSGQEFAGLFGALTTGSVIRDVGLITPSVSGSTMAGGLVAYVYNSSSTEITASYVQGGSVTLAGIAGGEGAVGGLAGRLQGDAVELRAVYSTAAVNETANAAGIDAGGLVGFSQAAIHTAAYAAGPVTSTHAGTNAGGFVGRIQGLAATNDSYCDTSILSPTTTPCVGRRAPGVNAAATDVPGKTAAELQTPTGYTGIYANWRVDVDGDDFPDQPWNFPAGEYPKLKTPTERQADQATAYDTDGDNLINVATQAQLNAVRYDLNGDGLPEAVGDYVAYAAAFPAGDLAATGTRMGCASGCIGYELDADLALTGDWTPIDGAAAGYAAEFNGNGRQITGLTVPDTPRAGLFGRLENGGAIRDLGLISPTVSGSIFAAGLVAHAKAGAEITASYVQGGTVTLTAGLYAGGLVGDNRGAIRAAYTRGATVDSGSVTNANVGGLTGNNGDTGRIIASYAASAATGTTTANIGGLTGQVYGSGARIEYSYCDTTVGTSTCIGNYDGGAGTSTVAANGYPTGELQTPTGYTGIYANWNIDLDGEAPANDYPWNFGEATQYPALNTPTQRQAALAAAIAAAADTLPPPLPRTIPPEPERAYNPAADHPEIYQNAEYEMATTCQTHNPDPETGNPQAATVTFDLGTYTGPILLHLSIWANNRYMAYETQGLALPTLERDGQRATLRVETDPAQTRFRLDGRRHGLATNLLLGYANCDSDDP